MRTRRLFIGAMLVMAIQLMSLPLLRREPVKAGRELEFNRTWAEKAFAGVQTSVESGNRLVIPP